MCKTILIVDDSPFVYEQIKGMVDGDEYQVIGSAKSGEEGIVMYQELKPDVVILDIIMPGIDGLETAEILLKDNPDVQIIMLSSLFDANLLNEIKRLGLKYLIPKPIEADVLLITLERLDKSADKEEE